jgi:cytochrome c oxidase cbb3-type subunit IV
MDIILFHSIWTVLMLIAFIGIWAWAWSSRRKGDFDAAAHLPFEDDVQGCTSAAGGRTPRAADDDLTLSTRRGEKHNG